MKLVKVTLITLIVLANTFDKIPKQSQYHYISEKHSQRKLTGEETGGETGGETEGETGGETGGSQGKDDATCDTTGSYIIVKYSQDVELSFSGEATSKIKTICSNKTAVEANKNIKAKEFEFYIGKTESSLEDIFSEYQKESISSLDFSNFKPDKLESMKSLFKGLSKLESINFGGLNTTEVTDMGEMFQNCSSLKSVNLSALSTSKVTNMASMFEGNKVLESLNLSNFKTSLVTNMSKMFSECENLVLLDISNFDLKGLTKSKDDSETGGSGTGERRNRRIWYR